MAEAVSAIEGSRVLLEPASVAGVIERRRAILGVPAAWNPREWFPHYPPMSFNEEPGTWGPDYNIRREILSFIYRALNQPDTNEYKPNDKLKTALTFAAGDGGIPAVDRERFVKVGGLLFGWLREADFYWTKANAAFGTYDEAVIPGLDTEKIDGDKLQLFADVFGPAVISYGQLLYRQIIDHLVPPVPPGVNFRSEPWGLKEAVEEVDAAIAGVGPMAAHPAIVAVRGQLGALPSDNLREVTRLIGRQLFKNLGGASEANRLRELGLPTNQRYQLKEISGADPWSGVVAPLRFWHDVKGLYQSGETNKAYQYITELYSVQIGQPATPWGRLERQLGGALMGFGQTLVEGNPFGVPAPAGNVETKTIPMIKNAQRRAMVVETMKAVMDGDSKKFLAIPFVVADLIRADRSARTDQSLKLMGFGARIIKEAVGLMTPPVDGKLWEQYKKYVGKNLGLDFLGHLDDLGALNSAYDKALSAAKGESVWREGAISLANLVAVVTTSKPQLKV